MDKGEVNLAAFNKANQSQKVFKNYFASSEGLL